MSISSKGWRRSSRITATASRRLTAALDSALSKQAAAARDARVAELAKAGVPDELARRIASLAVLKAAPDIVLVADRAKKPVAEVTATYFATEAFFQLDRVIGGGAGHRGVGLFRPPRARPRARFDRRRRAAARPPPWSATVLPAPARWRNGSKPRQAEVERIRAAIHEIAGSGLTLSKLSVAASLLGDLARE